ncbi:MAG: PDZ domain-containing protein [Myxococcota bacterium]|jgi:C-terminal processing protease CtpA/Prc|nr:PDZ domain-containing protein [Myxococcota bacterium]
MLWALGKKRLTPLLIAVTIAVGCAQGQDPWIAGIDAEVRYNTKTAATTVASVDRADGLQAGDRILSVDKKDISNASIEMVQAALRGPLGSIAVLSVERQGKVVELKMERRRRSKAAEKQP